ncbi:MAG: hypothetical protein KAJ19_21270, partial [Gammaproteobacteria bacterium]|nr:hypothetical protein [Gammaproteobacteria bacterium]
MAEKEEKKEKLSKKELDTIAFRDAVTKKLKNLESKEAMKEKAKAKKAKEALKAKRRQKRQIKLQGLKGFMG